MNERSSTDPPLGALREEIDALDRAIHDLLMRRMDAAVRVSEAKRAAGVSGTLFRPAREAAVLRRLEARHEGPFPFSVVARIWCEIMSATLTAEGSFSVSAFTPEDTMEGRRFAELARAHFGARTPMAQTRTESGVLRAVRDGKVSVGVLPLPVDSLGGDAGVSADPWWLTLAVGGDARPAIISHLPWVGEGAPVALVVANIPPEPSGDDMSFLALESTDSISRDSIRAAFAAVGLEMARGIAWQGQSGSDGRWQLIETAGFVAEGDSRLQAFEEHMGDVILRIVPLGCHPVPRATRTD